MMKSRNFIINILIAIFIFGFVSCGKDAEPPVYEKGNLVGYYEGTCTVSLDEVSEVEDFSVEFRQRDTQSLNLIIGEPASYESIGISTIKTASDFKDYGSYARFAMENINEDFGSDQVPAFIKNNIVLKWDINKVALRLNIDPQSPPTYTKATRNFVFVYTGIVEITGKNQNNRYSSAIRYTFNLYRKLS